jgi:sensor histidine kinase YesM
VNVLKKKTMDMAAELVTIANTSVNLKSQRFAEIAFSSISTSEITEFLYENIKHQPTNIELKDTWRLEGILNRSISFDSETRRVYLVAQNKTVLHKKRNDSLLSVNGLEDEEKELLNQLIQLMDETRLDSIWTNLNNTQESVYYIKKVVDINSLNNIGYYICEMSGDYFDIDINSNRSAFSDADLFILNKLNEIVSTSTEKGKALVDDIIKNELRDQYTFSGSIDFGGKYIYMYESGPYNKWQVICIIPTNDILLGSRIISLSILLAGLFCIISAMLISWFVSNKITQNLRLLEENMARVENEDFSVRIRPVTYDETGMLALRFNYMANKIFELIKTVAEQSEEQQRIRFEVMQVKINPHFLYNTLGSIKWMAHANNQTDIERMTEALIELLKAGLNKKGETCTVSEELAYIENYIFLQNMRYGNRIEMDYSICDESEDMVILPFLIQPIVENSIYHGFDIQKANNRIVIQTKIENSNLIINVIDNGVGMQESAIEHVFMKEKADTKEADHFNSLGIRSVHERIRFYFGTDYGVKITSEPGQGTCVSITLPAVYETKVK